MKHLRLFILLSFVWVTLPLTLIAEDVVVIPSMSETVIEAMKQGVPAGEWKATGDDVLQYNDLKKRAIEAEWRGKTAEALTLYERILDRCTTTEVNRSDARLRIRELRPKVQAVNTNPDEAKKWEVLVVIYKHVDCDIVDGEKTEHAKKSLNDSDLHRIGLELAGFRDYAFKWTNGLILPEFELLIVDEPLGGKRTKGKFPVGINEIYEKYRNSDKSGQKFKMFIAYVKHSGDEGPSFGWSPLAAIYPRLTKLDGASYMMIPWKPDTFTQPGKLFGSEIHELLHQVDTLVTHNLGYPRGTTISPDAGRSEKSQRQDGDQEYKLGTWADYYKHIMQEHITRQIWSELTTAPIAAENRPGRNVQIEESEIENNTGQSLP